MQNDPPPEFAEPVEIPIDGVLDLHNFSPKDLRELLPAYLEACQEKGIKQVRIIHGKGTGTLRETVHAQLRKRSDVLSFALGGDGGGSWGATIVELK